MDDTVADDDQIESKVTPDGQVSIPATIRQKLGLTPGASVVWRVQGDDAMLRRAIKYTSRDMHDALFREPPTPRTVEDMKEGIRDHLQRKHSRR